MVQSRPGSASSQSASVTTTSTQGAPASGVRCTVITTSCRFRPRLPWIGSNLQRRRPCTSIAVRGIVAIGSIRSSGLRGGGGRALSGLRRLDHVGFTVPDLDEATRFLVDVLGCEYLY